MRLNRKKILKKLIDMDRKMSWLAVKAGMTRQKLHYQIKNGLPHDADKIANGLGIDKNEILIDEV